MRKLIAYFFGSIGLLMQGGAFGIPVYVIFFNGSAWWSPAFFLLGFAGMIPITIMNKMLEETSS